jgi:hypothetical protein
MYSERSRVLALVSVLQCVGGLDLDLDLLAFKLAHSTCYQHVSLFHPAVALAQPRDCALAQARDCAGWPLLHAQQVAFDACQLLLECCG